MEIRFSGRPPSSRIVIRRQVCILGLEITAGREEEREEEKGEERKRAREKRCRVQALHEVTRGDGAWHNYYRSRITPPAGVRRSLRSRGANLPEYSLPRELISVVIIISLRLRLSVIASEFSRLLRNESFQAQMFAGSSVSGMACQSIVQFCADHIEFRSSVFKNNAVFLSFVFADNQIQLQPKSLIFREAKLIFNALYTLF